MSALVLTTNRHQDNEEEEEGKGEWFLDLHEAALMMHNKILLQNHQPGFQETETNENNEEDQVVKPGAEEILLCEDAVATLCESWVLHPRPPKAVASRSAAHHASTAVDVSAGDGDGTDSQAGKARAARTATMAATTA